MRFSITGTAILMLTLGISAAIHATPPRGSLEPLHGVTFNFGSGTIPLATQNTPFRARIFSPIAAL